MQHTSTHTRNENKTNKTHTHTIVTSRDPINTSSKFQFWSSSRTLRRPHCDSSLWHRTARYCPGQVVNRNLFPTSETNQTNGCHWWVHNRHFSIKNGETHSLVITRFTVVHDHNWFTILGTIPYPNIPSKGTWEDELPFSFGGIAISVPSRLVVFHRWIGLLIQQDL